MDPAMMQAPGIPPEQLEEMMTLLEEMGQALQQTFERVTMLEDAFQQLAPQVEEVTQALQSAMQPSADGQQPGGW